MVSLQEEGEEYTPRQGLYANLVAGRRNFVTSLVYQYFYPHYIGK
ncbi:hypothetical protein ACY2DU_001751 [Listeria innocua]